MNELIVCIFYLLELVGASSHELDKFSSGSDVQELLDFIILFGQGSQMCLLLIDGLFV